MVGGQIGLNGVIAVSHVMMVYNIEPEFALILLHIVVEKRVKDFLDKCNVVTLDPVQDGVIG